MTDPELPAPEPATPAGAPQPPRARGAEREPVTAEPAPSSLGNVTEHHWTRARAGTNEEALEYYRSRSQAPGVAEGGAERNFYCMECDGVIPHDHQGAACPHCGTSLAGQARRYFNWVEIDQPPRGDAGPLLRLGLALLALVLVLLFAAWWLPGLLG